VRGWLKVVSFTDPPDNLLGYRPWQIEREGRWCAVDVESARRHGSAFVAKIHGIDDRGAAERLANAEIAVAESALPALAADEFYWKDLLGMTVVAPDGERIGRVVEMIQTGANDVLVVESEEGRRLIPFVAAVIGDVDLTAKRLVADWRDAPES
jgi:16S rRNA processing protein RimM